MKRKSLPLLLLIFGYILLAGFMSLDIPDASSLLKAVKQDVLVYAKAEELDKPLVTREDGQRLYQDYLAHYFSPWNNPDLLYSEKKIKKIEADLISQYSSAPGWGINQQRHTKEWVSELVQNMNTGTYPAKQQSAITVGVTHLRKLPTIEPSFKAWADPSNGYPFDQMEVSLLPANLPIKVVRMSRDGAWGLVLTPYDAMGWLPFNDFVFVDKTFMQAWQTGHYAAVVKDKLGLYDLKQQFLFFSRIGAVHPLSTAIGNHYQILVARNGQDHRAMVQVVPLSKVDAVELPMPLTPRNLAKIANIILGQPYDWGGYYHYRDCSATVMDLFVPFGFWLPRSSIDQAHTGKFIALETLDSKAKQAFIRQHAVPFLTLVWLPGHIAWYLGEQNGQGFVYQTMWSISVKHWLKGSVRVPIGKTVVTPLDIGEDLAINTTGFIEHVKGISVLWPRDKLVS